MNEEADRPAKLREVIKAAKMRGYSGPGADWGDATDDQLLAAMASGEVDVVLRSEEFCKSYWN